MLSSLPQLHRVLATKDVRSFSTASIGLNLMSSALWLGYGAYQQLAPTLLAAGVGFLYHLCIAYYKKKKKCDE